MPEPATTAPLLVPEATARQMLGGISTSSIYKLRQAGLPHVKIGTRTMYDPADLAQWVHARKTGVAG